MSLRVVALSTLFPPSSLFLTAFEDEAREAHRGLFVYGDPGDSEDEEVAAPKPSAWGKPR